MHYYTAEGNIIGIHSTTNCRGMEDGELHIITIRKWETGILLFSKLNNKNLIEETTTKIYCTGKEDLNLKVEFDGNKKNYWISFFTPECPEFMPY